jgi:hypothetical protein
VSAAAVRHGSLAAVAGVADRFDDGAYFVDLTALRDPE